MTNHVDVADHELKAVITTLVHYKTINKSSETEQRHIVHTTDKRVASWSERANVYKEYMARSRHEAPRQNTFRRSRGSIEGCLEAPIKGYAHNT